MLSTVKALTDLLLNKKLFLFSKTFSTDTLSLMQYNKGATGELSPACLLHNIDPK